MATNQYFSTYNFVNEQELIDDLVVESIRMYGIDTFYISRSIEEEDDIMNEDRLSIFNRAHQFEVYVKNVDGFQGDGDFLSRFGLQIRDQITFCVARRTFELHATRNQSELVRPLEGDLVYLPMNDKFFKVMHVEHESVFYQSGALQVYDVKCELFEYSNERFETGVSAIDDHYINYRTDEITNLEDLLSFDPLAKNIFYNDSAEEILDFTETNPFEETITFPGVSANTANTP